MKKELLYPGDIVEYCRNSEEKKDWVRGIVTDCDEFTGYGPHSGSAYEFTILITIPHPSDAIHLFDGINAPVGDISMTYRDGVYRYANRETTIVNVLYSPWREYTTHWKKCRKCKAGDSTGCFSCSVAPKDRMCIRHSDTLVNPLPGRYAYLDEGDGKKKIRSLFIDAGNEKVMELIKKCMRKALTTNKKDYWWKKYKEGMSGLIASLICMKFSWKLNSSTEEYRYMIGSRAFKCLHGLYKEKEGNYE
jgi:hypothetical protein